MRRRMVLVKRMMAGKSYKDSHSLKHSVIAGNPRGCDEWRRLSLRTREVK